MTDPVIEFFSELPDLSIPENELRAWLLDVSSEESHTIRSINIILVTDDELLAMNRQYLNHDYYTDIITFDLSDDEDLAGEVYISLDRVKDNAGDHQVTAFDELCRVIVHGLLHLIGYNDKDSSEQAAMRSKEDYYLSLRTFFQAEI